MHATVAIDPTNQPTIYSRSDTVTVSQPNHYHHHNPNCYPSIASFICNVPLCSRSKYTNRLIYSTALVEPSQQQQQQQQQAAMPNELMMFLK
jgi:hypothetical protein